MSVISAAAPRYRGIPYKISAMADGTFLWRSFPPPTIGAENAGNGRCYSEAEAHAALRNAIDAMIDRVLA